MLSSRRLSLMAVVRRRRCRAVNRYGTHTIRAYLTVPQTILTPESRKSGTPASRSKTPSTAARRVEQMGGLAEAGDRTARVDVTDDDSLVALRRGSSVSRPGRRAGQQRGLRLVRRARGRAARPRRGGSSTPTSSAARLIRSCCRTARAAFRTDHQHLVDRREFSAARLVQRHEVRRRRVSESLLELAPLGIAVIIIEPGAIKTEWGGIAGRQPPRGSGRGGTPPRPQGGRGSRQRRAARGLPPHSLVVAAAVGRAVTDAAATHPVRRRGRRARGRSCTPGASCPTAPSTG